MTREAPLGVGTKVVAENGRWAVYLGVDYWDAVPDGNPVETIWHRIADYPTPESAEVAARWYGRGADRPQRRFGDTDRGE